ncbi:MAG TPA: SDR family NAD(P)-dependent oxidoreductase [Gaiellaceae bacterium]|nr:SDR family NAD(P)-dependent oxidoreductase [Gaiellaceae bacterium]
MPRVAVVTGASSGIGAALVRNLARRGWHCVLVARRADRLQALAEETGGEAEPCDVVDRAAVEAAARRVLARHPRIELLVNNAGIPGRASFLDGDPEAIERVLLTNYLGSVWCLRAFLPGLEAAAPSDLVNVVSVAGTFALPASGPYAASKHAQLAFSRAVAAQLRPRGIHVHTVKPGFVETEGFPQRWLPRAAQRLVLDPDRVAVDICDSIERHRGERTVPRYYAVASLLQTLAPNLVARALARAPGRTTITR